MKQLFLILSTAFAFSAFGQTEILDSIRIVQLKKDYKNAESFCTPAYWKASSDGGINTFRQICDWSESVELKLHEELKYEDRAVITGYIYYEGILEERIFMFLVKESGSWLIDGFKETELLTDPFLKGIYSGHFSPYDLPYDQELKDFGEKIVSFGREYDAMYDFLKENTAFGSTREFIAQIAVDTEFEPYFVNTVGYDKRVNKGFLNFMAKHISKEDYYNEITIYVSKHENGKLKILEREYSMPSVRDFLNLK